MTNIFYTTIIDSDKEFKNIKAFLLYLKKETQIDYFCKYIKYLKKEISILTTEEIAFIEKRFRSSIDQWNGNNHQQVFVYNDGFFCEQGMFDSFCEDNHIIVVWREPSNTLFETSMCDHKIEQIVVSLLIVINTSAIINPVLANLREAFTTHSTEFTSHLNNLS